MEKTHFLSPQFFHSLWRELRTRFYFKFVLPRKREIALDGVRLDVSPLSLTARNRLLNVGYEVPEKLLCKALLRPEDSVLEIGAAIGFIALFCQKVLGIRQYIACEANPHTLDCLKRNYALNGVDSDTWNLALGPANGQIELDVGSEFWENAVLPCPTANAGRKTVTVPAATLEAMLSRACRRINTLIIDVEGAERFIDPAVIPEQIEKVIIELHPHLIGAECTQGLVSDFARHGFELHREMGNTVALIRPANRRAAPPLLPEICLSQLPGPAWQPNGKHHGAAAEQRPKAIDSPGTPKPS